MFITFEGVDGSGKTTQAAQTVSFLRDCGYDVLAVREPGGTPTGDRIRQILLDDVATADMNPRAELLLFCASRAQLVAEVIIPHLEAGGVVVSDRYTDSTMAYQGYGHGLNLKALKQVNDFATAGLRPDMTLFLDIEPEEGLARRIAAGEDAGWNRLDAMALDFHRRVYRGYRNLVLAEPARFVEIDARADEATVQERVRAALAEWLEIQR
ncbi:MAG: dTMP kinase [Anaerolineaceae bacterium]|nr:MAG: dTMP kinase [Anaerolineaceae bacterium]